ncbi:hypothetical protein SK128_017181 [Halocaridina rubra]|uniref:Uncharacterized protein n=1 Tax=Halocaridina rubra TaxID=373956 RepID=A0AAN8ZW42_HALRR
MGVLKYGHSSSVVECASQELTAPRVRSHRWVLGRGSSLNTPAPTCLSTLNQLETHNTIIPEREAKEGASVRDIVSSIVRSAWAKAQEWTVAWKAGSSHLKMVVETVINLKEDEEIAPVVHEAGLQLHSSINKMACISIHFQTCVRSLEELLESLKRVQNLQSDHLLEQPLFSTLTMHHMVSVLESVCGDYKRETEIKAGICSILPDTRNVDTLNTAITLWTHHVYLVTHQFPLKSLLRETQQM